ncbi:MAG: LCP family protein [Bacillota bacterium]|nr:LCP family protein [Bacillota bacterium]
MEEEVPGRALVAPNPAAARRPPRHPSARGRRARQAGCIGRGLRLGAALLALALTLSSCSAWLPWNRGGGGADRASSAETEPASGVAGWLAGSAKPVTVLVLGVMQGPGMPALTDSILLVSVDPARKSAWLLSIPRDTWVEIPGHGQARINEAYVRGGADLAEEVVADLTGVRPDRYVVVDYSAFKKLVDDVGGVTVDVPRTLDDPTFPAPDERHYAPLYIPKGVHHFNGEEALAYVRERHADPLGDLGRAQRQQQVLLALKDQFLKPANLPRVPAIAADLFGMIKTDFPLTQVPAYAALASEIPGDRIRSAVLDYASGAVRGWVTPGGAWVLLPDKSAIRGVVRRLEAPPDQRPARGPSRQ